MFEIKLTPQAERDYRNLDTNIKERVDRVFERLHAGNFHHRNIRAMRGRYAGSLRYRMGKWRIVFSVDSENRVVWVEAITTRGRAYR